MPRVLLADDDLDQLRLRVAVLEAMGHRVAVAINPSEAVRQLDGVDIVVMDLKFPNEKGEPDPGVGLALIRRIREGGRRLPVIVLSGWPEALYGAPEEQMVSRILVKPVGTADLLQAISDLTQKAASAHAQNPPSTWQ